jgi:hypothetical protein
MLPAKLGSAAMRVLPPSRRSVDRRERRAARRAISAELARIGQLQSDLEKAQARYEREISLLGTAGLPQAVDESPPLLSRAACFEDLLALGLTTNQARRVLQYLDARSLVKLLDA